MRTRLVGAAAAVSLFVFGFAAGARADSFTPTTASLGPNHDVVPDGGSWRGGQDFTATYTVRNDPAQYEGEWDFEAANPFRTLAVDRSFDQTGMDAGRAFFASQHAAANQEARLTFFVQQTGDRDGDDRDDFRLSLVGARLIGSPGARLSSFQSAQAVATPEPASLLLLGSGLAGLVAMGVRRRR